MTDEVQHTEGRVSRKGPAAGSRVCPLCNHVHFSDWGHAKTCPKHPESDRNGDSDE